MPRLLSVLALALASVVPARSADADMSRFNTVVINPSTAYLYIAAISMTMQPFVRHQGEYASTYTARVFPIYYSEKGRIWIHVPDADLLRVARGESIDFTGHAVNDDGDGRRVEGHASPTGSARGRIRVKVYVTRRIALTYDTTYALVGTAAAPKLVMAR